MHGKRIVPLREIGERLPINKEITFAALCKLLGGREDSARARARSLVKNNLITQVGNRPPVYKMNKTQQNRIFTKADENEKKHGKRNFKKKPEVSKLELNRAKAFELMISGKLI